MTNEHDTDMRQASDAARADALKTGPAVSVPAWVSDEERGRAATCHGVDFGKRPAVTVGAWKDKGPAARIEGRRATSSNGRVNSVDCSGARDEGRFPSDPPGDFPGITNPRG